jgi:hypothetical protein
MYNIVLITFSHSETALQTTAEVEVSMEPTTDQDDPDVTLELLANLDREMVPFGRSFVDDPTVISKQLANEVFKKAIILQVTTVRGTDDSDKVWEGQAGLIRKERLTPSSGKPNRDDGEYPSTEAHFAVTPVTAKHNIESRVSDGFFHRFETTKILIAATSKSRTVAFPEGGWEHTPEDTLSLRELKDAESPSCLDVTWGTTFANPSSFVTAKSTSFEMVDDLFEIARGQKIAIVVSRRSPVSHKSAGVKINAADLERYYGTELNSNIQTGVITGVAGDGSFFTHDINTFKGCSGAIVFLLDVDQPSTVSKEDHGKAIGVHGAGAAENTKFAFALHGKSRA